MELAEAHLAKIERLNPDVERIRARRCGTRSARGSCCGSCCYEGADLAPLHGVPISIKSSLDVAGMRMRNGNAPARWQLAANDAPLVAAFAQAGAIMLGVTNTPETADGVGDGQSSVWADQQPVGSRAHSGGFQRRRSGCDRRGNVGRQASAATAEDRSVCPHISAAFAG